MPPPAYNIIPGDWQSVEYAINDLCTRIITEDIPTSSYILVDGTRAFTGKVSGIYPTEASHLSTKEYVDDEVGAITETDPIVGAITGIVKANGAGVISAASAGTDYEVPLTFSTGLTRAVNTVTVNTSQNISTLSNLTDNGFIKTSGGIGALSIDTATYQPSHSVANLLGTTNQVSLSASGTGVLVGSTNITLSLPQNIHTGASPTVVGLTLTGLTVSGFVKNSAAGVLSTSALPITVPDGGTGLATLTAGRIPYGAGAGALASSANLTFDGTYFLPSNIQLTTTTTSTTGVIYKGTDRFIHDFHHPTGQTQIPVGNNLFIGVEAGNFTTGSTAIGSYMASYNTGIGYRALKEITTGYNNFGIGAYTLSNNQTGQANIGIGSYSGNKLTTGSSNLFLGYQAGYRQTTNGNLLIIDNQQRADVATELSNAIIYGVMNAAVASQTLRLNAAVTIPLTLGVTGLSTLTGGAQIGASGNLEKVTNDLTLTTASGKTLVLSQPVYKDLNLPGALLVGNPTQVPGTDQYVDSLGADTGIETYAFAEDEGVHGGFELQHDYKEGTDLTFHVHWQGIAAPTGTDNVQWRLTYIVSRDNTALAAAVTIDSPDTAIDTQYKCYRSDFAAITGTNFKIGDQFMFSLQRVAATGDAYAGDALIMTAGVHYQIDTIGSRSISAK